MNLLFSSFLFFVLLLQTTIFPAFFQTDIKPDFFLGLALYAGLFYSPSKGLAYGLAAGALLDIFTEGVIGSNTLSLMCIGLLTGYVKNYVLVENLLIQTVIIIVSTLLQRTFLFIYNGVFQLTLSFFEQFGYFLFIQILLNIIFSLSIFSLFNYLKTKKFFRKKVGMI